MPIRIKEGDICSLADTPINAIFSPLSKSSPNQTSYGAKYFRIAQTLLEEDAQWVQTQPMVPTENGWELDPTNRPHGSALLLRERVEIIDLHTPNSTLT